MVSIFRLTPFLLEWELQVYSLNQQSQLHDAEHGYRHRWKRPPGQCPVQRHFSSLGKSASSHLPSPGTIIASSYTSPLDVIYLAAIFDPIFTQSYAESRNVQRLTFEAQARSQIQGDSHGFVGVFAEEIPNDLLLNLLGTYCATLSHWFLLTAS